MKEKTGIVLLVIIYGVGLTALLLSELREVVLPLSPYTLLLSFLILLTSYRWGSPIVWAAILVFSLGFSAEWIGVHKGWLFGIYYYGPNLGPKISSVPVIIGINWAMLTFVTGAVVSSFIKNRWGIILVAALLMTGLDFVMEPVAVENGYWFWKGGKIPLYNYLCWFLVALLAQGINAGISKLKANNTSWVLFLLLILFFVIQFFF